ncbi:hypothetical protein BC834DRAFT_969395 [Gloeopeniophorella convolvens]|nr:hypothetical protein BC834DRAFT_969395 [Gloeopeniophorella convolvens]
MDPSAQLPPNPFAGVAWDNTLGALLIGGLASGVLFGITCMQTYIYYERNNDKWTLRAFVAALWAMDAFDFAITCHIVYFYVIKNFANPFALLGKPVWSLAVHVVITSVADFSVRIMFARRIWRLSNKNTILTAGILVSSTADLVVGTVIAVRTLTFSSIAQLQSESTMFYINFACGAFSDVYVAVVLSYFLARSRTGVNARMDSIVTVLMLYTINTGLLTAADACAGMILFVVMPDNFIYITFYFQLSKLYTNAFLATLNNRESLREKTEADGIVSIHLSRMSHPGSHNVTDPAPSAYSRSADTKRDPLAVMVQRQIDVDVEPDTKRESLRYE